MFKVILLLVLINLAFSHYVDREKELELRPLLESYKKINNHLSEYAKDKGEILDAIMREARRWLEEEVSESSDAELKAALTIFTSMNSLEEMGCTKESYDILENNEYLSGHRSSWMLISGLVTHYGKEHAKECIRRYSEDLRVRYGKVSEEVIEKAHEYADAAISLGSSVEKRAQLAYKLMEKFSLDDPDRIYLKKILDTLKGYEKLDNGKLWSLYNKHLLEPCRQVVEMSSKSQLENLKFDMEFLGLDSSDTLAAKFPDRYTQCMRLIKYSRNILFEFVQQVAMAA